MFFSVTPHILPVDGGCVRCWRGLEVGRDQPRGGDAPRGDILARQRRARHHQRDEPHQKQRPDPRRRPLVRLTRLESVLIAREFRSDRHADRAVPARMRRLATADERRALIHRMVRAHRGGASRRRQPQRLSRARRALARSNTFVRLISQKTRERTASGFLFRNRLGRDVSAPSSRRRSPLATPPPTPCASRRVHASSSSS